MKRKTDNFSKFFEGQKKGAALKEEIRQEKKAAKKERKAAIERHFEEKRRARSQQFESRNNPEQDGFKGRGPRKGAADHAGPSKAGAPGAATQPGAAPAKLGPNDQMPLNKYIAHSGLCSRRDAADLIRDSKVEVNGQVVTEPGTKVSSTDMVKVSGKKITISRNFVYILLNKPKDYITTTEDPQGRKTVLDLIRSATQERVFPVGRLDRNTSGVLLLTNDGDLAQKLAHPKHEIKKIYHVALDKPLTKADFDQIIAGEVVLEDGPAIVDVIAYADSRDKTQIGLEIHSGRNRIVRRIFEHLGYDVRGLDRVTYAGLTKKNVQRGKWRLLTEKEIRILKYLNASFKGSPEKMGSRDLKRAQAIEASFKDSDDDVVDLSDFSNNEKEIAAAEEALKRLPGKKKATSYAKKDGGKKSFSKGGKSFGGDKGGKSFGGDKRPSADKSFGGDQGSERPAFGKRPASGERPFNEGRESREESRRPKKVTGVKRVGKSRATGEDTEQTGKPFRSEGGTPYRGGKRAEGGAPYRGSKRPASDRGSSDRGSSERGSSGRPPRSGAGRGFSDRDSPERGSSGRPPHSGAGRPSSGRPARPATGRASSERPARSGAERPSGRPPRPASGRPSSERPARGASGSPARGASGRPARPSSGRPGGKSSRPPKGRNSR